MARKSRVQIENKKQPVSREMIWNIAVYIRLSREDARCNDESESVTNQRKIILEFIEKNFENGQYEISGVYVDDGRSGTTEDTRPDFQRLCRQIEAGKINCVICKTLSRAFRNYADQGKFLEQFLPTYGCRFIAVNNPFVDTFTNPDCTENMEIPINGLMNDRFAAKTSADIRRTFATKRSKGEFIGAFAPYGYLKNPENKNALVIDEQAVEIIRDIFSLYLSGMSKNGIVRHLNDRGIPCPALYKKRVLGLKYENPHFDPAAKPLWSHSTIHEILKNRMYCGDMVQGRYRVKSYKVHVQERVDETEWYIVPNTHEAIIDRKTFEKVQRILAKDTRVSPKNDRLYLFSGFLKCADCGKAMARHEVKGNVYYYCTTYKNRSKKFCTKHRIRQKELEAAVLYAVRQQIYLALDYTKSVEQINRAPLVKSRIRKIDEAILQKEKVLTKITRYKQAVYQDWKDDIISESDYFHMREDYEREETALREAIRKLEAERKEEENSANSEVPFLAAFRRYGTAAELTRDVLVDLVDHIKIFEGGNISIVFNFTDELKRATDFAKINSQMDAV